MCMYLPLAYIKERVVNWLVFITLNVFSKEKEANLRELMRWILEWEKFLICLIRGHVSRLHTANMKSLEMTGFQTILLS